jgi:hypothetical protein
MYFLITLAEYSMIIFGILALTRGKLSIGGKTFDGRQARIAGLILILPLPIAMIISLFPLLPPGWRNPINLVLMIVAAGIAYAVVNASQTQTGDNPVNRMTRAAVVYDVISFLYFLLFLASFLFAALAYMSAISGDIVGVYAVIRFLFISSPIIIIGILWGARYFYRKGQIKATFLILLVPPLLLLLIYLAYLVSSLLQEYVIPQSS